MDRSRRQEAALGGRSRSICRPSSPRCRSTTGSRLPRNSKATRATPATRSIAGITGRRSSSGIAIITSRSSPVPARPTASRCSARWRRSWPRRPRNGSKRPASTAFASPVRSSPDGRSQTIGYGHSATREKSPLDDFPKASSDAARSGHDRDVPDEIGRAGSVAAAGVRSSWPRAASSDGPRSPRN